MKNVINNLDTRRYKGLSKIMEVLELVFEDCVDDKDMDVAYRVHVEKKFQIKIINLWCFNPGFAMANLLKKQVRSIILTSGTLAPLNPLISELDIKVDHQLENPHIIKNNQLFAKIIYAGPDNQSLCGNYVNRENEKYMNSMGMTIIAISRETPNGVLVFFPSYPTMTNLIKFWRMSGIWASLVQIKSIFIETRDKDEFGQIIQNYYNCVKTGAIFMGVMRGKHRIKSNLR